MKLSSPYDVYTLLWEQLTGQNAIQNEGAALRQASVGGRRRRLEEVEDGAAHLILTSSTIW